MRDRKRRSLAKAISWRVVAIIITILVSFIVTKKILIATTIGIFDSLIKIMAYYYHERVWEKINFGRKK